MPRVPCAVRSRRYLQLLWLVEQPLQVTVARDRCSVCPICLSCLSVCNIGVVWPNSWIDQDATCTEVGLGQGDIVLDGNSALPRKGAQQPMHHLSAYVLWSNDSPSQQLLSSCVIITDHLEHSVECVYLSVCLCVRKAIFEEMTFRLDICAVHHV